jgi:hypothetical protein
MQRSKGVAAILLVGTFVAGAVIGIGGDRYLRARRQTCPSQDRHVHWDAMAKTWGLTATQRTRIDSLLDLQHERVVGLYKPLRTLADSLAAHADAISDSTQARIRLVLTPAQQLKFDAMRATSRKRGASRACHEDKKP